MTRMKLKKNTVNSKNKSTWNDSYKIGIPLIDKQHKMFFDIYDDLLIYNENNGANDQMLIVIKRLKDYTYYHFSEEEALMKAAKFEGLAEHQKQHRFFEKKVSEFQLAHTYKNPALFSQMLLFIRQWLLSHISQVDFKFKDSLLEYMKNIK